MRFFDFLFPPRDDELRIRDVTSADFLTRLAPQIEPCTRPSTVILLPFADATVRSTVHEAKYHGSRHAFSLLSDVLTEYVRDADDVAYLTHEKVCLIPVPLSAKRKKRRGYNQVEEVIRRSGKDLGYRIDSTLLERVRDTQTQVSLAREMREENMRGAFRATHTADPSLTYLLVDDVITTGATLQAAVDALRAAGAAQIIPIALAH